MYLCARVSNQESDVWHLTFLAWYPSTQIHDISLSWLDTLTHKYMTYHFPGYVMTRTNMLSWIFIVLIHWNYNPRKGMSPYSDTSSWFRVSQSLFFLRWIVMMLVHWNYNPRKGMSPPLGYIILIPIKLNWYRYNSVWNDRTIFIEAFMCMDDITIDFCHKEWVSDCCLTTTQQFLQLCHDENKHA
jgi:hypothetical protein